MLKLTEKILDLIESRKVLKIFNNNSNPTCKLIQSGNLDIILYQKLRITIMSNYFLFINIKLKNKLSRKKIIKICELCSNLNYRPCMYNKGEFIYYIELVNIKEQKEKILEIIQFLIDSI